MNVPRGFLYCGFTMLIVGGVGLLLMNPALEGAAAVAKLNSVFFIALFFSLVAGVIGLCTR